MIFPSIFIVLLCDLSYLRQ